MSDSNDGIDNQQGATEQALHEKHQRYWRKSLRIVLALLAVWFVASFGAGILFKDWLDQFSVGNAPMGFWMAQQGSIIIFIGLLITYALMMNKLDREFGYDQDDADEAAAADQANNKESEA